MGLFAYALFLTQALQPGSLKSIDMVVGTGSIAAAGDRLTIEYTGNLLDGKVFYTSVGKAPSVFTLGVGKVIKGWDQGMAGMRVGGRRVLSIPATLGYGSKGDGLIPANSPLVFEVKLLRVDKKGEKPKIEIEELKAGTGDACKAGDTVDVHVKGTFLTGTLFWEGDFPFTLGAKKAIAGFDQGTTGMKRGQKRRVTVPSELGYGAKGRDMIPPDSTLVFEIELIKINGK